MGAVVNSRRKGVGGELEARDLLRSFGVECHRGRQYSGSSDSPDIRILPPHDWLHLEVKRYKASIPWLKAFAQAQMDSGADQIPGVLGRIDHGEWMLMMRARQALPFFIAHPVPPVHHKHD